MKQTPNINLPILEQGDKYLKETQNEAFSVIDREIAGINSAISVLDNVEGSIIDTKNDVETLKNETNTLKASLNDMESNVIPNIQTSLDNVETEIEENKTLTDSEISKLKEIANTWETFKASGGEISGNLLAIQLATKSTSNNYRWAEETHDTGYKIISSNTNPSTGDWREEFIMAYDGFAPKNDKVLGTSENPWNDIYLKGVSKSQTGYTKLPNGMLLQWGMIEVKNQYEDMNIWYPVSFPEYCLGVWFESHMNVHNDKREWVKYGTWNNHNLNMFTFRMEGSTNWVYPMWFAIGY